MNDQAKKSPIRTVAAGLLGFVGIVGLGSLVIMHHGGAAPKAPVAFYSPVNADPAAPAPLRAAGTSSLAASAAASSPAPMPPSEAVRNETAAAAVSAPSAAPQDAPAAAPGAKLVAGAKLASAGSASSSASASVAAAAPALKAAPARKPFSAPKLDLTKTSGAVASTVHYGVSGRSELMGRAAGPVYNFSGNAGAKGGQVAADNASASGALQQVDAVQKQVDASDVPDAEKAKLDKDLNQVRQTAAAAPAAP